MNKKFLSAILFGALMVTSTGTFVSCKDYDDDIDRIDKELSEINTTIASLDAAIKAGKSVQSCNEVTGGYELVFTDGSKITIKNGINGTNGTNGENGTTVIPEFRVEGNYWQYSTDKGATWVDVKDTEGNKVPAKGEDGASVGSNVSWVTIDGVEYIKIGDKVTDLKQNNEFPNIAVDSESKTVIVTVDGQNYTLLQEGSAFKGLQTVVYRKQAVNDGNDVRYAYNVYNVDNELFAAVPAYASFKVYPGDFSLDNAKFSFVDTYKLSRSVEPALVYMNGSATLENGILKLAILPNEGISEGIVVATSLDVTMYGQYTSASDYFTVGRQRVNTTDIKNAFTSTTVTGNSYPRIIVDGWGNTYDNYAFGKFNYQGTYNVNDSIDAYIQNANVWVKETGIVYEKAFRLLDQNEEYTFQGQTIKTHQGIFELKDNVLSVKSTNQASAIDEYAAIEVTTTVKAQEEGIKDYPVKNVVFIKAVRPTVNPNFATVALKPLNAADNFAFTYNSAKSQVITLDVRDFENAIEGRDVVAYNNSTYSTFVELWKPVYDTANKLVRYENMSQECYRDFRNMQQALINNNLDENVTNVAKYLEALNNAENEAILYYKNGGDNADKDSLFLILTPGANQEQIKKAALLMGSSSYFDWNNEYDMMMTDGVNTPYGVYNKYVNKLFKVTVNDFSVTYEFDCPIKEAYKNRIIIGEWTPNTTTDFIMRSKEFNEMYDVVPEDAQVKFVLDPKKQNEYVQEMMKSNNIQWTSTNRIEFTPRVDLAKVGKLKVDIYDITAGDTDSKRIFFRSEEWTVQTPIKSFSTLVDLAYNNPALATGEQINLFTLINGLSAANKAKWTNLVLQDVVANKLVVFDGTNELVKVESIAETLYQKNPESTGVKVELSDADKTEYSYANGILTWNGVTTGTVYEHDVVFTITYTHDWGVAQTTFKVKVSRK